LLEAIDSVKDLKLKIEVSKHLIKVEAEAHLEKKREWAQNLIKYKRVYNLNDIALFHF